MQPTSFQRRLFINVIFLTLMSIQGVTRANSIPIHTSGELSTIYRERTFNGGEDSASDWLTVASFNAASYIWQPWFALMGGSLSFSTNEQNGSNQTATKSEYIGGQFNFNLFPSSRFPFQLYASKSQNSLDDTLFERTIDNTHIGMKQQYDSANGRQSYTGGIEQSTRVDFNQSKHVTDNMDFRARFRLDNHSLNTNIDYSNATVPDEKDSTNFVLEGRHSYSGATNLSWENSISRTQADTDFINTRTEIFNDQLSSFLSWRPDVNADINVTGNLLFSELRQSFNLKDPNDPSSLAANETNESELPIISLSQGLTYNYSPRITITESLNATQSGTSGNEVQSFSESAGIHYSSESTNTTAGLYGWNLSSSISLRQANGQSTETTLSNQAGHSLSKEYDVNPVIKLQSSISQSLGYNTKSSRVDSINLNHALGISFTHADFNRNTSVRLTLTDTRSNGISENSFQLFNLQLSNEYQQSRNTTLSANITYQMSQVTADDISTLSKSLNGQVSYNQSRFFNIPELLFKSRINFSKQIPEIGNELSADNDTSSHNGIENELIYRIGLFEARANLDYIRSDDSYNQIFMLQLTRTF